MEDFDTFEPDLASLELQGVRLLPEPLRENYRPALANACPPAVAVVGVEELDALEATINADLEENAATPVEAASPQGPRLEMLLAPTAGSQGQTGPDGCRIVFTGYCHQRMVQDVWLRNAGTTVVFYQWHQRITDNALGRHEDDVQRFFLDCEGGKDVHAGTSLLAPGGWGRGPQEDAARGERKGLRHENSPEAFYLRMPGAILPGDTRAVRVAFCSPNAGVFSEAWSLSIHPNTGGAPLELALAAMTEQLQTRRADMQKLEV